MCLFVFLSAAAATRSVWDGVYTKAQADRGKTTYGEECLKCHGETLGGGDGGPALVGGEFLDKWDGKTAGDLFAMIRKAMPPDDPGSLSSREYSDVLAYILSNNDFPAGQKEMDPDVPTLSDIRIERKK